MSEGANTTTAMRAFEHAPAVGTAGMSLDSRSTRIGRTRIAVIGEFNSGKTTLVNALLGADVLTPSVIANTAHPTVVRFAPRPSLSAETADRRRLPLSRNTMDGAGPENIRRLHVGVPLERLKVLSVIDTPGLGFADEEGDRRSLQACRNADTVIWCTPAMQAWKATEERAWLAVSRRIRARGVLAVTFADEVPSQADAGRLLARLRAEAGPYFRRIVMAGDCPALVLAARQHGDGRSHGCGHGTTGGGRVRECTTALE